MNRWEDSGAADADSAADADYGADADACADIVTLAVTPAVPHFGAYHRPSDGHFLQKISWEIEYSNMLRSGHSRMSTYLIW